MSAARSFAVPAVRFTKSRAASGTSMFWMFLSASVTGAKAPLKLFSMELVWVSVVMAFSILRLSYGLTPSGSARGRNFMTQLMVRCNIFGALRYHEVVTSLFDKHNAQE